MSARAWAAPRAAYLLTAAMADRSERPGVISAAEAMSDEWSVYSDAEQCEILIALGAQTRVSLELLRDKLGLRIEMDWGEVGAAVCAEALALGRGLVAPEGGPWVMPECAHCREVIGTRLCRLQIQAYFILGFTSSMIAETCRSSAGYARRGGEPAPVSAQ